MRSARGRRAALLACAGLLLSACGTLRAPPSVPELGDGAQRAWLQKLERYSMRGRIAGAVGKEGFNAQLDLQQRGDASRLQLRSPLGFGSATVETDGRSLEFSSSRGERLNGPPALQALAARLGFEPPLSSLRYWVLGVPDPLQPAVEQVPADGAPRSFEQNGWRVTLTETTNAAGTAGPVAVPRRVTLEREAVRLRIVVDTWQLGG